MTAASQRKEPIRPAFTDLRTPSLPVDPTPAERQARRAAVLAWYRERWPR